MSPTPASDPVANPAVSKAKNNKKKKKAAAKAKAEENASAAAVNGAAATPDVDAEDGDEPGEEVESPTKDMPKDNDADHPPQQPSAVSDPASKPNGAQAPASSAETEDETESSRRSMEMGVSLDTQERLEALAKERNTLRAEVTELRKSLETIQGKHQEEMSGLQGQLEECQAGKEHAETQYRNLLGKVNTIKSQLGERLKQDAEDLAQARSQIEDYEEQARSMKEANEALMEDLSSLRKENEEQAQEISSLRSRASLTQQNWIKERDELIRREAFAREEFETAKQAMQDWEVLAMEERSLRESLGDRVTELEEQLSAQREAYEKASSERDSQSLTVDGLQRALQDIQDARKKELRELVENSQKQLEELRKQLQAAEEASAASKAALEATKKELERALPFEKEVKEKNLLIGKLRHEAVILNDHLTKALRMLKKGKPEDNVDRQIVTNYLLHFLSLDRSDPKKFQSLQLIAALLNWNEEQREQAGLARPGASNNSLRVPLSPFRRTPSTPSLNSDHLFMHDNATNNKETLAELWSNFLEQEAASEAGSRRGSTATTATQPASNSSSNSASKPPPGPTSGLGIS